MDFAGMKRRELQALCREHGLAARGSKADLASSLAGAISEGASAAAAEKVFEVMVGKGCLKRSGNGPSGGSSGAVFKKVTFSFKEKEEAGEALVAAKVSRRGRRQKHNESVSSGEGVTGEVCADAQVIWSRTNAMNLRAGGGIERRDNLAEEEREVVGATVDRKLRTHENPKRIAASVQAGVSRRSRRKSVSSTVVDISVQSQNDRAEKEGEVIGGADLAEAEGDGKVVQKAVDSKRKQKTLQNANNIAANAHAGISRRSTRSSNLSADDVLLCHIVGKKRGRGTAEPGVVKKSSEVRNLLPAASPDIIESKKSQRKEEYRKLAERKSAKLTMSDRVTRSCSVHAAAPLHVTIENKMKTETVHLDRVAPAVSKSDVPRNDAPITRSLRNRVIQKDNTMPEETHVGKKLEKKRQPRGSAIGRHKQFSSSLAEEVKDAAPCKSPPLLENARSDEIKNGQCEDVGKQPPVRRSTRNCVVASRT